MNQRIEKIRFPKERTDYGYYPWCFLAYVPSCECVFDSYRGTVGYDIITTRIAAANEVFLKVYGEDNSDIEGDAQEDAD